MALVRALTFAARRSVLGHGTSPHLVLSVRRSEVLSDTLHQVRDAAAWSVVCC